MPRTNSISVQGILAGNYDPAIDLTPFINAANIMTNSVLVCAAKRGITLDDATLQTIETWLSAYAYTSGPDPLYKSRHTGSASGTFARGEENEYLKMAKMVDPSGCVNKVTSGKVAGGTWLGKTESEQSSYEERN